MLFLLVVPFLAAATVLHRILQIYAPTNVLIRTVRTSKPSLCAAAGLLVLALALLSLMHAVVLAIDVGAPAWLNLVALLLAWDFIKIGLLTSFVSARLLASGCRRVAEQKRVRFGRCLEQVHAGAGAIGRPIAFVSRAMKVGVDDAECSDARSASRSGFPCHRQLSPTPRRL